MGLFSNRFSKNKDFGKADEKAIIKNQILQQPNANEVSDSYLNGTGNYGYNVKTIPAQDIDMSTAMAMDSPHFWNHKNNTKEDYMNLASKLPRVQEQLNSGKTLDEIKEDPELRDCASAYYNPDKMVRVRENDNGDYEFEDDGRHRVAAAQELGYDVPVQNLSKPVQEQTNNNLDADIDSYTYNPENENYEKNGILEDEIYQNDNANSFSDGNHYMDEEDNGYSPVKAMDGSGNNYTSSEEAEYDGNDFVLSQDSTIPSEGNYENSNHEWTEDENGATHENEQDPQQEKPETLGFEEDENGVSPENEPNYQQEQSENQDLQDENGATHENEQDPQQGKPETLGFDEVENGESPENEQDSQQELPKNQDIQDKNGKTSEYGQVSEQKQPERSVDNGQDADNSSSSDGHSYSDADMGDSMTEDFSMSI